MKALLLALMLVPSVVFAETLEQTIIRLYGAGDPAFEAAPNPYIQPQAQAPAVNNKVLEDYLRSQSINNRTNLISPPDVQIFPGDSFGDIQYKRELQRQDAFGRAVTSSALEALQPSRQRGRGDYNRYFGN